MSEVFKYYDAKFKCPGAKIKPGEVYVTGEEEVIVTVLGSCIAACIHDPRLKIGGMNHFMLPSSSRADDFSALRYGNYAMEHLLNGVLRQGGSRDRLEVKLFGGGAVLENITDIGRSNIEFVESYVKTEKLRVLSEDVGGNQPRKVVFFPTTGRALVKRLSTVDDQLKSAEKQYLRSITQEETSGEVELF